MERLEEMLHQPNLNKMNNKPQRTNGELLRKNWMMIFLFLLLVPSFCQFPWNSEFFVLNTLTFFRKIFYILTCFWKLSFISTQANREKRKKKSFFNLCFSFITLHSEVVNERMFTFLIYWRACKLNRYFHFS